MFNNLLIEPCCRFLWDLAILHLLTKSSGLILFACLLTYRDKFSCLEENCHLRRKFELTSDIKTYRFNKRFSRLVIIGITMYEWVIAEIENASIKICFRP